MSTRECWLLGSRVRMAIRADEAADVILSWRLLPGYVPVMLGKRRALNTHTADVAVREATAEDMPAIRGLYAMTGGRAQLLLVRAGLWEAPGALVAEQSGKRIAYCMGSAMNGLWNIHEWGIDPEADVATVASAFAAYCGCRGWQLRAEFAPQIGRIATGECVYIGVPKPFLLGTVRVESAQQLAEMIEATQV